MRRTILAASVVVVASFILIQKLVQSRSVVAQTPTAARTKLMVLDFTNLSARVVTDLGVQTSVLKGQIAFAQTLNSSQPTPPSLVSFNAIGSSVRTRRGYTGTLGLKLSKFPITPNAFDVSSGKIAFSFQQVFHYSLIDELKGDKQMASDYSASLFEGFKAELRGQFTILTSDLTTGTFTGRTQLDLAQSILGGVLGLEINIPPSPIRNVVGNGLVLGLRGVFVQPVFVRSGPDDPNPTGRSWEIFRDRALAIWSKVCVTFVFRQPIYVDNEDHKVILSRRAGVRALRAADRARNYVHDAILVLLVETYDPFEAEDSGGATTLHSGAESAGIIVADSNHDRVPPSDNVLAHELGHAFGLCHPEMCDPGDNCSTLIGDEIFEQARGSIGTVMNNSGSDADSPDLQSSDNWRNISNPLLALNPVLCQLRVDCRSDCGNCTQ